MVEMPDPFIYVQSGVTGSILGCVLHFTWKQRVRQLLQVYSSWPLCLQVPIVKYSEAHQILTSLPGCVTPYADNG